MKKRSGFTLIELLIVVAIIAILAAIAVPNFLEAQTRAKISRNKADMQAVATAMEMYHIDYSNYAPAWEAFTHHSSYYIRGWPYHYHIPSRLTTPVSYISTLPRDPFNPEAFVTAVNNQAVNGRAAYYYPDYLLKVSGIPPFATNLYRNIKRVGGNYVFVCYGPDKNFWNTPPGATNHDLRIFRDYDATNGTLSIGNIIRSQSGGEVFGTDKYFYTGAT